MTIDPAEAKTTFLTAHKLPPLSVFESETQKDRGVEFNLPRNDLSRNQRQITFTVSQQRITFRSYL